MSGRDGHYHSVDKNAETNINFQKVCYILESLCDCYSMNFTGFLGGESKPWYLHNAH
jgi:hypothetical protein